MGQPIPNIPVLQIYNTQIPDQRIWSVQQPFIPNVYPVTNHLGFPIVDIPG